MVVPVSCVPVFLKLDCARRAIASALVWLGTQPNLANVRSAYFWERVLSNQVRNFGLRLPCHAACLSSDLSESSLRYPLVTDQSSEYSIRYTVTSRR